MNLRLILLGFYGLCIAFTIAAGSQLEVQKVNGVSSTPPAASEDPTAASTLTKGAGNNTATNSSKALDLVRNLLKNYEVVEFAYSYCPHCKRTTQKLRAAGISFHKLDVDLLSNPREIIEELKKISGIHTLPQVFVGATFIGDGSKTRSMIDSGEFQRLLKNKRVKSINQK